MSKFKPGDIVKVIKESDHQGPAHVVPLGSIGRIEEVHSEDSIYPYLVYFLKTQVDSTWDRKPSCSEDSRYCYEEFLGSELELASDMGIVIYGK